MSTQIELTREEEDHNFYKKRCLEVWQGHAKFALQLLCPESSRDAVREASKREMPNMSVEKMKSIWSMHSRDKVSVWIWDRPLNTLRGLLYKSLGTWIVASRLSQSSLFRDETKYAQMACGCTDCFPPALDEFTVCTDAEIYEQDFNHTMWFPRETMCVVFLGMAKRNNYLTEVLNSFVRRRMLIGKQRTIFLFSGTRQDFIRYYGQASSCELNRDSYIIDFNADAESQTNKARHVTEPSFSFVEKTTTNQTYQQMGQKSDDAMPRRHADMKWYTHKNTKTSEDHVVLEEAVSNPEAPTTRQFKPHIF